MFRDFAAGFEYLFNFRYPAASHAAGRRIDQSVTISDLKDIAVTKITKKIYAILKDASKLTSDNYPENMGLMFVVNAPWSFSAVWSICKSFIDERTQKKIQIMSSGFEKKLLEVIDKENLPVALGGTSACAELGGGGTPDAGPWQDYVPVAPFGAKHKSEVVATQAIEETKEAVVAEAKEQVAEPKTEEVAEAVTAEVTEAAKEDAAVEVVNEEAAGEAVQEEAVAPVEQ